MSSDKNLVYITKNLILCFFRATDDIIQICTLQIEHIKHRIHSDIFTIKINRRTNFQIYSGTKFYMFRAVSLPNLRSYPLYIRHWHMLYRFDDSLRAGSGWNCSSSAHHQELSTVHSALAHVIQVWRQLACRIILIEFRTRINLEISAFVGFCCKEICYSARPYERKTLLHVSATVAEICNSVTNVQYMSLVDYKLVLCLYSFIISITCRT
jgi:hypothetical protein